MQLSLYQLSYLSNPVSAILMSVPRQTTPQAGRKLGQEERKAEDGPNSTKSDSAGTQTMTNWCKARIEQNKKG